MTEWRGWPPKRSALRRQLNALYWGDGDREAGEGWFLFPAVASEVMVAPLAAWRDAHLDADDYDTRKVLLFAAAWGHWRAHMGDDLVTRQERGFLRVYVKGWNIDFPPPCAMLLYGPPADAAV